MLWSCSPAISCRLFREGRHGFGWGDRCQETVMKRIALVLSCVALLVGGYAFGAETPAPTGAFVPAASPQKKATKSAPQWRHKAAVDVDYENADEAAAPGTQYETRLFKAVFVPRRVRDANGHWHRIRVTEWVSIGSLSTFLDASEHFGFESDRFRFHRTFLVRGETWRGATLVASREMLGTVQGVVEMKLIFGTFAPSDVPPPAQKGTLSIHDGINGVTTTTTSTSGTTTTTTSISFTEVRLFDKNASLDNPNAMPLPLYSVVLSPVNGTGDSRLDYTETATMASAPVGEYKVLVVSTVPSIGNFVFSGTTTITAGATVSLDMKLQ